jgi:hypothetical protein
MYMLMYLGSFHTFCTGFEMRYVSSLETFVLKYEVSLLLGTFNGFSKIYD